MRAPSDPRPSPDTTRTADCALALTASAPDGALHLAPGTQDSTLIEYVDGVPVLHHLHQDLCVHVAPSFYRRTLV